MKKIIRRGLRKTYFWGTLLTLPSMINEYRPVKRLRGPLVLDNIVIILPDV